MCEDILHESTANKKTQFIVFPTNRIKYSVTVCIQYRLVQWQKLCGNVLNQQLLVEPLGKVNIDGIRTFSEEVEK